MYLEWPLKNQDWIYANNKKIQALLEEKHRLHRTHMNDPKTLSMKMLYDSPIRQNCARGAEANEERVVQQEGVKLLYDPRVLA